mgnify:CR=1 FL=1
MSTFAYSLLAGFSIIAVSTALFALPWMGNWPSSWLIRVTSEPRGLFADACWRKVHQSSHQRRRRPIICPLAKYVQSSASSWIQAFSAPSCTTAHQRRSLHGWGECSIPWLKSTSTANPAVLRMPKQWRNQLSYVFQRYSNDPRTLWTFWYW